MHAIISVVFINAIWKQGQPVTWQGPPGQQGGVSSPSPHLPQFNLAGWKKHACLLTFALQRGWLALFASTVQVLISMPAYFLINYFS